MYVKEREYKGTEMSRMDGAQRWPVVRAGERTSMWKVGWEGKQVGEAAPALIYDRLAADGRIGKQGQFGKLTLCGREQERRLIMMHGNSINSEEIRAAYCVPHGLGSRVRQRLASPVSVPSLFGPYVRRSIMLEHFITITPTPLSLSCPPPSLIYLPLHTEHPTMIRAEKIGARATCCMGIVN